MVHASSSHNGDIKLYQGGVHAVGETPKYSKCLWIAYIGLGVILMICIAYSLHEGTAKLFSMKTLHLG